MARMHSRRKGKAGSHKPAKPSAPSWVRYKDKDLLESGWLIGEKVLAKKAAMINAEYGDGNLVLIGFRTQHRFQTHGTFKLLFNTIIR